MYDQILNGVDLDCGMMRIGVVRLMQQWIAEWEGYYGPLVCYEIMKFVGW